MKRLITILRAARFEGTNPIKFAWRATIDRARYNLELDRWVTKREKEQEEQYA